MATETHSEQRKDEVRAYMFQSRNIFDEAFKGARTLYSKVSEAAYTVSKLNEPTEQILEGLATTGAGTNLYEDNIEYGINPALKNIEEKEQEENREDVKEEDQRQIINEENASYYKTVLYTISGVIEEVVKLKPYFKGTYDSIKNSKSIIDNLDNNHQLIHEMGTEDTTIESNIRSTIESIEEALLSDSENSYDIEGLLNRLTTQIDSIKTVREQINEARVSAEEAFNLNIQGKISNIVNVFGIDNYKSCMQEMAEEDIIQYEVVDNIYKVGDKLIELSDTKNGLNILNEELNELLNYFDRIDQRLHDMQRYIRTTFQNSEEMKSQERHILETFKEEELVKFTITNDMDQREREDVREKNRIIDTNDRNKSNYENGVKSDQDFNLHPTSNSASLIVGGYEISYSNLAETAIIPRIEFRDNDGNLIQSINLYDLLQRNNSDDVFDKFPYLREQIRNFGVKYNPRINQDSNI